MTDPQPSHFPPPLRALPWVASLAAQPGVTACLGGDAHITADTNLPPDHFFTALLRSGLVVDMLCLFDSKTRTFYTIAHLGNNVCGHPGVVHGGLTAALMDDTLGGLVYVLKHTQQAEGNGVDSESDGLPAPTVPPALTVPPGPAFTVQLDVSYRTPVPAGATVCVSAELTRVDGRKAWVAARLGSCAAEGSGVIYATASALFVVPKAWRTGEEDGGVETEAGLEGVARRATGGGEVAGAG